MREETGKNGLESYWKLGAIGGPLDKMKFTHERSLADFAKMPIQLQNGGGIYVLKGAGVSAATTPSCSRALTATLP